MCRTRAMDSTISLSSYATASAAAALLVVLLVAAEGAGGRELAQFVADHGLGDKHRDVLATIVHGDRVTQHCGDDHRATRPGLDDVLGTGFVLNNHLAEQVLVDEGALLKTAWHLPLLLLALLAGGATANDVLVALLVGVAGATLSLAPRGNGVTSTGRLALTTTMRVVDRVHGDTADGRADALPAVAAGLAPVDVRLLGVADLADRGAAARVHVADLARGETQLGVRAVLRHEANRHSGRAGQLRAAAGAELDRVDHGTGGDVAQRQVVAGLDVRAGSRLDDVTLRQLVRRDDVALLAVHVVEQRDACGAVGVVLDVSDLGVHAVLVIATEVDDAVLALVATADVAGGDATLVVATTGLGQRAEERLLRRRSGDLGEVGHRRAAATRGRGLVLANSHISSPLSRPSADCREDVDGARLQRDDGALGVLALAGAEAGAAGLADAVERVDRSHLDAEDLLDGELDLGLGRAGVHEERVLALVDEPVALLGDDRLQDDVPRVLVDSGHAET